MNGHCQNTFGRGKGSAVKWQIWMAPEKYALFSEAMTPQEERALKVFGYELEHEFEAVSKANAEAYFVGWCDNMAEVPNAKDNPGNH